LLCSLKSSRDSPPMTAGTTTDGSESGSGSGSGSVSGSGPVEQAELATAWLANLATGDSTITYPSLVFSSTLILAISIFLSFLRL
jgi:hypothetical protein